MNSDIHLKNISDLEPLISNKSLSLQDIVDASYNRINSNENYINAWKHLIPLKNLKLPLIVGPLYGLCLGVKDIIATRDAPTTMGTREGTWQGTQGGFDARVISKIRSSGATIIGKNKTSEFAVHEPTDTVNPRNSELTPGTSSSGGAAAVAAGHVSVSISSQTAGSIARPASYCGVIGFKPSFGELPRTGVLKTTEAFDTIGIIGNTISNIAAVFNVARTNDLNHPIHLKRSSLKTEQVKFLHAIGPTFDSASERTRRVAISLVSDLIGGQELHELAVETKIDFKNLRIAHEDIYAKELSYFLKDELSAGSISEGLREFGQYGERMSMENYREKIRFLNIQRGICNIELGNSIIFALSASDQAPKIGEPDLVDANLFWTSLGLPQVSLPLLESESGNPVGLSIIGYKGSDTHLLNLAQKFFPGVVS
jgi:Asp-tRNA(Asn)/Glu-tRNA(Gln) amidotransferase A subunit family amidase